MEVPRDVLAVLALLVLLVRPVIAGDPAPADDSKLGELSLEELSQIDVDSVFGASKYEQKVTEAPSSVTIVTSEQIRRYGYRTLAEILSSVRGLYITYDRNYSNFGIRGFNRPGDFDTRVLLLVDGHRMNDNRYDSALIGTEGILDVDLIERVELIRGPSSSIYGNSAFFGVINVITRSAPQIDGFEASASGGSQRTFAGRLSYGKRSKNGLEVVLSGSAYRSQGDRRLFYEEFDDPANNHGIAEDLDHEDWKSAFVRVGYKDWTVSGAYSLRNKTIPTASYGTIFNDGREEALDERYYGELRYAHAFSDDSRILGRAYYDWYGYRATYPYDFGPPGGPPFVVVTKDRNSGNGVGAEGQYTHRFGGKHAAVFGVEYRKDLNLIQASYLEDPKVYLFRDDRSDSSLGVYGQAELQLRSNLVANAGVRYDRFSQFGGTINPRLGLIYNPWEKTTLKMLYGQAFRAPNAYELYQVAPGFSKANPDLDPEKIRTYELVLEQYLSQALRLSVSTYDYDISGLISQVLDPADGQLVYENVDRVKARGAELELQGKFARGLQVRGSYAVQRAEDDTGTELTNSPRHLVKLNVSGPILIDTLTAGLEAQHTSRLETLGGHATDGFTVVNATLLFRPRGDKLEISATARNLLDQAYAYPGSTGHRQDVIPQDGRTWRLKATLRF